MLREAARETCLQVAAALGLVTALHAADDGCKDVAPPSSVKYDANSANALKGEVGDIRVAGDTWQARQKAISAFYLERNPKLDPTDPVLVAFSEYLGRQCLKQEGGKWLVNPKVHGYAAEGLAKYQSLAPSIAGLKVNAEYKRILAFYYANGLMGARWEMDLAYERDRIRNIPASAVMVTVKPGGLLDAVATAWAGFGKASPLSKKLVLDAVADLNPNLEAVGYYIVPQGKAAEKTDHVAMPLGGGREQVCLYEVKGNARLLMVPADAFPAMANPKKLDLRGYWISDLAVLRGLTPVDLDISYTQITDIRDLAPLEGLSLLSLRCDPRRKFSGIEVVRAMESLKDFAYGSAEEWRKAHKMQELKKGEGGEELGLGLD